MSLPSEIRFHKNDGNMEKYLIRKAFDESQILNSKNRPILPKEILWRRKEAFSDGVSKQTRSLYEIIQEFTHKHFIENDSVLFPYINLSDETYEHISKINTEMNVKNGHLIPKTAEQYYYRKIFESHYYGMGKIVPYFWMPKYIEAKDASARTLSIYSSNSVNIENK